MHRKHKFDMYYIDDMMPYERDLYVSLSVTAEAKEAEELQG
jgi:hypothetical protein